MIVENFAKGIATILRWLIGLIPDVAVPDWLLTASDKVQWLMDYAADFTYWLPMQTAATVGGVVMLCMAIGVGFKLARMILSAFTGGGGGAG